MAPKRPHTTSFTSQQKAHVLSDPEKLVSPRVWKEKSPVTPNPTLSAPGTSFVYQYPRTYHSKEVFRNLDFSQRRLSSPQSIFPEHTLEEDYFESVSFSFLEIGEIKTFDFSIFHQIVSAINQVVPISFIPPKPFVFQEGGSSRP